MPDLWDTNPDNVFSTPGDKPDLASGAMTTTTLKR